LCHVATGSGADSDSKFIKQLVTGQADVVESRGGHGSGVDSDRILHFPLGSGDGDKNFCKNGSGVSLVIFRSNRSLRGLYTGHFLSETLLIFVCIDDNRSLNRSRILKIEKISDPHPDSKILEDEWSRKM